MPARNGAGARVRCRAPGAHAVPASTPGATLAAARARRYPRAMVQHRMTPGRAKPTARRRDADAPSAADGARLEGAVRWTERGAWLVAVAIALAAHVTFLRHAGGLWRDEANTAAFAAMPSLAHLIGALRHDSVPLASTLLFRAWSAIGLGADAGLRTLGLLVGLGVLGALAWSARVTGARVPAASLVLVALGAWTVRGGDAIRPTGLGVLAIVLAFATLVRALERPDRLRVVAALAAAVLAVQSIYANVPLVAALALAAIVAGALARSRERIALGAGVGAAAALSLLPYLPAVRAASAWSELVRSRADFSQARLALGATRGWDVALGALLALAALVLAWRTRRDAAAEAGGAWPRAAFAATALVAGAIGFAGFVAWSRLPSQPWYYLPAMALAAVSIDALLAPALRSPRARLGAALVVIGLAAAHAPALVSAVAVRQTNLDRVAARVAAEAAPNDLVVVTPWFCGVTFQRYYHGRAPWITIPPLADHAIHRYDLVAERMREPGCADSTWAILSAALDRGGRLWLVGRLPALDPDERPEPPGPAPDAGLGWSADLYGEAWEKRIVAQLLPRLVGADPVEVPVDGAVSEYEDVPLFVLSGRR